MFIVSLNIIGSNYQDVPLHLSARESSFSTLILLLLSLSFIVIAFSRLSSKVMFSNIIEAILKNKKVSKIIQISYPLNNLSSILLLLNYIISFSALLFLTIQSIQPIFNQDIIYIAIIALILVFVPWISFSLVGFLTGEKEVMSDNKINTIVFAHASGLIFSIILLIWTFNPQWSQFFVYIFLGIVLLFTFYRILRGFLSTFKKGVAWYYLILYLCTLEILPFILLYQFMV